MAFFNTVKYIPHEHAIDRWRSERVNPDCSLQEAAQQIKNCCQNGQVIIDLPKYRYIRHENYVFPCKRTDKPNTFVVMTVLTWDMWEGREQAIIKKYA